MVLTSTKVLGIKPKNAQEEPNQLKSLAVQRGHLFLKVVGDSYVQPVSRFTDSVAKFIQGYCPVSESESSKCHLEVQRVVYIVTVLFLRQLQCQAKR